MWRTWRLARDEALGVVHNVNGAVVMDLESALLLPENLQS